VVVVSVVGIVAAHMNKDVQLDYYRKTVQLSLLSCSVAELLKNHSSASKILCNPTLKRFVDQSFLLTRAAVARRD
jgi:hypothetical protein